MEETFRYFTICTSAPSCNVYNGFTGHSKFLPLSPDLFVLRRDVSHAVGRTTDTVELRINTSRKVGNQGSKVTQVKVKDLVKISSH